MIGARHGRRQRTATPPERAGVGFVPIENVVGRVVFIYWSSDIRRIGMRVE